MEEKNLKNVMYALIAVAVVLAGTLAYIWYQKTSLVNELTIDKVQRVVCDYFSVSREDLLSKSRKRNIVQARQIAMYMSRSLINCSLSTIGSEIGGKDHATVLHACTTVSDLMSTDKTFRQYVNDIEKILVPVKR